MGETKPILDRKSFDVASDAEFRERLRDWARKRDFSSASELIGTAVVMGRESEAREAAKFLVTFPDSYPNLIRLAKNVLNGPDGAAHEEPEQSDAEYIHGMRDALKRDPRNGLVWIDLARIYSTGGHLKKAEKAMRVAVSLAPESRFVLRSAARLFVHRAEYDVAHNLLLRTDLLDSDPWLMAAEIAVASLAECPSVSLKAGRRALASGRFSPLHATELASAVATTELANGATKNAKKLFKQALIAPTENTVAQARWASKFAGIDFDGGALTTVRAFEARAWQCFYGGQWRQGLDQAIGWSGDEPFSARPLVMAAYFAGSMLGDHEKAVTLTRAGLRANHRHPVLINNLIFYLLESGRNQEAINQFRQLRGLEMDAPTKVVVEATVGMYNFRVGRAAIGREYYENAIASALRLRDNQLAARAAIHLAIEEVRIGSENKLASVRRAMGMAKKIVEPDIGVLVAKLGGHDCE